LRVAEPTACPDGWSYVADRRTGGAFRLAATMVSSEEKRSLNPRDAGQLAGGRTA